MQLLLKRLVRAVLTIIGAISIVFLILRLTPGDPVEVLLGDYATPELIAIMRKQYGLDQPLPVQYAVFLQNTLTGNFGYSLSKKQDVTTIIGAGLPYTAALAVSAMVVTCIVGIPLGTIAALKRGTMSDFAAMVISLLGVSMPGFLLALILIWFLSYQLNLFPIQGAGERAGPLVMLWYLVLPSVALGFQSAALVARTTRSALLSVLSEDYIRTAHAKGLAARLVIERHAFRNALVPILAVLGLYFGQLLGGAAVA